MAAGQGVLTDGLPESSDGVAAPQPEGTKMTSETTADLAPAQETQIVALPARQKLLVDRSGDTCILRIVGPEDSVRLSIEVGPGGPVIHVAGAAVAFSVEGDLAVEAERIRMHGRQGLSLSTGGDLTLDAEVDMTLTSRLGDANIKANDYVRFKGELIKLNC
jgi:hypothetical protein